MDGEGWPVADVSADMSGGEERQRTQRDCDADLLTGVRRNELRALRQFVQRFEPILLDQARRLDVSRSERRTVVTGFLDDILVRLARAPAPRSLASFVITSFRNCVADVHREAAAHERNSLSEEMDGGERVVRAGCSEFMLRSARGPDADDEPAQTPGIALMTVLLQGCSVQEKQLLVWSAHRVPLRECAAWLGISYDSAKQRLSRLRARLVRESIAYMAQLPASDRAELSRKLHIGGAEMSAHTTVTTDNDQTRGSAA
jgi:DNA-directed RNA polymerase specialized sigma24 family protein